MQKEYTTLQAAMDDGWIPCSFASQGEIELLDEGQLRYALRDVTRNGWGYAFAVIAHRRDKSIVGGIELLPGGVPIGETIHLTQTRNKIGDLGAYTTMYRAEDANSAIAVLRKRFQYCGTR
jgi:hypothetical protein